MDAPPKFISGSHSGNMVAPAHQSISDTSAIGPKALRRNHCLVSCVRRMPLVNVLMNGEVFIAFRFHFLSYFVWQRLWHLEIVIRYSGGRRERVAWHLEDVVSHEVAYRPLVSHLVPSGRNEAQGVASIRRDKQ